MSPYLGNGKNMQKKCTKNANMHKNDKKIKTMQKMTPVLKSIRFLDFPAPDLGTRAR